MPGQPVGGGVGERFGGRVVAGNGEYKLAVAAEDAVPVRDLVDLVPGRSLVVAEMQRAPRHDEQATVLNDHVSDRILSEASRSGPVESLVLGFQDSGKRARGQ